MLYFITVSVASTSSLLTSFLIVFHSLVLLTLLLFKRIYYTNWMFFSTACALTLLFFHFPFYILSRIMDDKFYFHGFLPWLSGGTITWILSFPLLGLFQWIDRLTIKKTIEYKRSGGL